MLNLFNRVVYLDESSGFNGCIESVEMYNYFKSIPTGLTSARMTYLCEPMVPFILRWHCDRSHLSELNHIIDATFSKILNSLIGILLCNHCALHYIINWKMD